MMDETKTDPRPVILWDCNEETELLHHTDKKHAIEAVLDGSNRWDGTIIVYGYARMVIPQPSDDDAEKLVVDFFEGHWGEYSGEDGPDITDRMEKAALTFLTVLHKEFVPWACEQVTSEEVDVATWIAKNHPDWLKR